MSESSCAASGVSVDAVAVRLSRLVRLHRPADARSPDWLDQELTFSQLRLLFLLREQGPVTMSGLAEALAVTAATASGVVERIERRGLVERRHRPDDRRVVECVLTEAGERLVREMAGARLDALRAMLAVLTPEELAQFDRLVGLIVERLGAGAAS